jgi:uncharacterized membrane protein HdeD (DUF308 family)
MATTVETRGGGTRAWRWAAGLAMVALGVIAIAASTATGFLAVVLAGTMLAIAGMVEVLYGLGAGDKQLQPLRVLGGLLSLAVGGLVVLRPMAGLTALTFLLAAYFLAAGLFHSATALLERHPRWGWDFLYGACAIVLSVIALSNLRGTGLWLIGTLVGIEILARGIALSFGGFRRGEHVRSGKAPRAA